MGTSDSASGEIINIGPDKETVSILGLAEGIAELMNFDLDPIFMPNRPLEVEVATSSADKAADSSATRPEPASATACRV